MIKTEYHISKMDCPSEENLIPMKLEGISAIKKLDFDIENRELTVYHIGEDSNIKSRLDELNLGTSIKETININESEIVEDSGVQLIIPCLYLLLNQKTLIT